MFDTRQLTIVARDVTGQRTARWGGLSGDTLCSAITVQAVEQLDLPTVQSGTQDPIIYHCFDEERGERLPAEEKLDDILQRYRQEMELRVRVVPELEAATK
jgi:hypothetical protein